MTLHESIEACVPFLPLQEFQRFRALDFEGQQELRRCLRGMAYPDFCASRYWWSVKAAVFILRGHGCKDCHNRASQVHHLTYEHHGEEHLFLEDLIPLCGFCHAKRHGNYIPMLEKHGIVELTDLVRGWIQKEGLECPIES